MESNPRKEGSKDMKESEKQFEKKRKKKAGFVCPSGVEELLVWGSKEIKS